MVKAGSSGASLLTRAQGHILRQHKPPLLCCLSVGTQMTAWRPVILAVALAPLAGFPQDLSPEVLMLARVKSHAREELARIPNYTCVEVLQRFHKTSGPKSTMKPLDTMQLEVAQIGGREMYSWLGDRNFKEDDPAAFIGSGMIGNGLFAAHLRSLFVAGSATFQYR